MSCFNGCTSDNWWIIIVLLFFLSNDDCNGCLDCLRNVVCGDNLIWIICLLLLCNSCNNDCDSGCNSGCGGRNSCGCN